MLKNIENVWKVLNSPFDINIHKDTFINYLEVVISKNGTIEYAVPSHQIKVTDMIAKERNISRKDVEDLCPLEYYTDYNNWLCIESGAVMVWNNFYMGKPNDIQIHTLIELMTAGLYHGKLDINRDKTL